MPQFAYRARDAQGSLIEGVLDCADRAVAIHDFDSRGRGDFETNAAAMTAAGMDRHDGPLIRAACSRLCGRV